MTNSASPDRNKRNLRILIVGTLPPPICGTTVSLQHLLTDINRHEVEITTIDTGGIRGSGLTGCWRLFRVIIRLFHQSFVNDVVALHLNPYAVPWLGIVAWAGCRLSKAKLIIRLFGGACFSEFKGIQGWLFRWVVIHCDTYLAQTMAQVKSADDFGISHVRWYPTSRPPLANVGPIREACRRFIFVGWVCESKGIREILAAGRRLAQIGIQIDVYGPFRNGFTATVFDNQHIVSYCGVIPAGAATSVIAKYDALLLPTHWEGEGYPGVILEAYQAGLPVIATRWRTIPEIVSETSGILISPRNADELSDAIHLLATNNDIYTRLQHGARETARRFSTETWTDCFIACCHELVGRDRSSPADRKTDED